MLRLRKRKKGFTLVEMALVILITSVLVIIAFSSLMGRQKHAAFEAKASSLKDYLTKCASYSNTTGQTLYLRFQTQDDGAGAPVSAIIAVPMIPHQLPADIANWRPDDAAISTVNGVSTPWVRCSLALWGMTNNTDHSKRPLLNNGQLSGDLAERSVTANDIEINPGSSPAYVIGRVETVNMRNPHNHNHDTFPVIIMDNAIGSKRTMSYALEVMGSGSVNMYFGKFRNSQFSYTPKQ